MITWHVYDRATAPSDRPIALLSVHPQEGGGHYVSLQSCHVLGLNFESGVGDNCATHWCELEDLALPL